MRNWKTSNYEGTNTSRHWIGLQFFAEGGDTGADTGADMDGDFGSDFEAALSGDGLEDQQPAAQDTGEGAADGLENQQPEGQQEEPENKGAEDGQQPPPAQQERPPVPLTYNGQQILLPGEAVEALRGALGLDPVGLIQKGMNYDHKAARELRLLDQYAAASGMTRQQYIGKLEAAQRQQELAAEVEKCRGEFPEGTPDAALTEIAKNRIASRQAAERQQAMQRQSELQQVQQRAQQAVNQARQQAQINAWDAYEQLTGVHKPEDIPPRVMELVQQEGMTPVAAHWRYQSEQKDTQLQIKAQNQKNKAASAGSMAGGADPSGFEAEFMNAFKF